MKLRIYQLPFFIFLASACAHQSPPPVDPPIQVTGSSEAPKQVPRPEFKSSAESLAMQIDALKKSTQYQERVLEGYSAEGASAEFWSDHSGLVKVEIEALHESGRSLTELFLDHGHLLAAREQFIAYGANIMELKDKPTPTQVTSETWLEFSGKNLKRWLENGKKKSARSREAKDITRRYLLLTQNMGALAKAKDPRGNSQDLGVCRWICQGFSWSDGICKSQKCAE